DGEVGERSREHLAQGDQLGPAVDRPAAGHVRPLAVHRDQIVERRPVAIGQRLAEPAHNLDVLLDGHASGSLGSRANASSSYTERATLYRRLFNDAVPEPDSAPVARVSMPLLWRVPLRFVHLFEAC